MGIVDYYLLMVFRIRDKSLFWTKSGWKNTWEPKILNMPKPINSPNTQYVTCRFDHHSFLRSKTYITKLSRPIVTSQEHANNISTEMSTLNSFLSSNYAINSNCLSIARHQWNSLRTELYSLCYSGTQIRRSNR